MDRKELILSHLTAMLSHAKDTDTKMYIYPNIPNEKASNARSAHKLDSTDEILYLKDFTTFGSCRQSILFTKSCWSETITDHPRKIPYENITAVRAVDNDIYIDNTKYESSIRIRFRICLFISNEITAKYMNLIAQQFKSPLDILDSMLANKEYEEFLIESKKILLNNTDTPLLSLRANRVRLLIERSPKCAYMEARTMFLNFQDTIFSKDQDFEVLGELILHFEELSEKYGEFGKGEVLEYWVKARDLATEQTLKREFHKRVDSLYAENINSFLDTPYHKRKFLAIDSKLSMFPESLKILSLDELPIGIEFPHGHPIESELYICHPYKHNLYIPYESCEFELFKDKVSEYCEVLQCLGAKEVFIEDSLSDESTNKTTKNSDIHVEAGMKINSLNADIKNNKTDERYESFKRKLGRHQTYEPVSKLNIPDGLVWYPHETDWQRLYAQRQRGSVITYDEFLSISTELQASKNELTSVKVEFKALILKIKGDVKYDVSSMFENKTSSEWKVSVVFYPLSELPGAAQQISTNEMPKLSENKDSEAEYREEVEYCLNDDGVIDGKERTMLSRLQKRLGISDLQAREIEDSVGSSGDMTDDEKEYAETYKEFLEDDGVIDDKERSILNRTKSRYGISDQRAIELENQFKN